MLDLAKIDSDIKERQKQAKIKRKDERLFGKILDKAEKNGYNGHVGHLPMFVSKRDRYNRSKKLDEKELRELWHRVVFMYLEKIVYSHDFAKAFWGEGTIEDRELGRYPEWLWHLQVMVSTGNPLSYLEEFINEKHTKSRKKA